MYRIIFPNGKMYFGISKNPKGRFKGHCNSAKKKNDLPLYNAIRKHGAENLKFEILVAGIKEYIAQLEISAIAHFETQNRKYGYNITSGGELSPLLTESVRLRVSNSLKGRKPHPSTAVAASRANKGKKASPETIAKLIAAKIGKPCKQQTKIKISESLKGQRCPQDKKNKISNSLKGKEFDPIRKARCSSDIQKGWDRRKGIFLPNKHYQKLRDAAVESYYRSLKDSPLMLCGGENPLMHNKIVG